MIFRILKKPVGEFDKFSKVNILTVCGTRNVPQTLCKRAATVAAIVAVNVVFTEPIKFQRKTTNPYQITPLKQNRSAALKMAFLQLFVFPDFPHFSGSNLSAETCMDGK